MICLWLFARKYALQKHILFNRVTCSSFLLERIFILQVETSTSFRSRIFFLKLKIVKRYFAPSRKEKHSISSRIGKSKYENISNVSLFLLKMIPRSTIPLENHSFYMFHLISRNIGLWMWIWMWNPYYVS